MTITKRAHLITGGFPPGSLARHDMNFARLQLLQELGQLGSISITVANDFYDLERWLPGTDLLVRYVAGPYPDASANKALQMAGDGRTLVSLTWKRPGARPQRYSAMAVRLE